MVVVDLEADRRRGAMVERRPSAQRSTEMSGPDLNRWRQRKQALMQGAVDVKCALGRLNGQVGAGDVADEERVAGEHGDRLGGAGGVA
jgi:hypothetical protein